MGRISQIDVAALGDAQLYNYRPVFPQVKAEDYSSGEKSAIVEFISDQSEELDLDIAGKMLLRTKELVSGWMNALMDFNWFEIEKLDMMEPDNVTYVYEWMEKVRPLMATAQDNLSLFQSVFDHPNTPFGRRMGEASMVMDELKTANYYLVSVHRALELRLKRAHAFDTAPARRSVLHTRRRLFAICPDLTEVDNMD